MRCIQIAICDDEEFYRIELEKFVSTYGNEYETELNIELYENALQLLQAMEEQGKRYDLIFFDVEMPGLSGIEAARQIYRMKTGALFCFVTAHDGHALSAFEVEAIDYIVKPIAYSAVKRIMKKAKVQIYYSIDEEEVKKCYLEIISDSRKIMVELSKVIYIEKRKNQCVFHMTDGEHTCYDTLKSVYKQLESDDFIFTHQGYIANFPHIKDVTREKVRFGNGVEIPISRKYYESTKERHMNKIYQAREQRRKQEIESNL